MTSKETKPVYNKDPELKHYTYAGAAARGATGPNIPNGFAPAPANAEILKNIKQQSVQSELPEPSTIPLPPLYADKEAFSKHLKETMNHFGLDAETVPAPKPAQPYIKDDALSDRFNMASDRFNVAIGNLENRLAGIQNSIDKLNKATLDSKFDVLVTPEDLGALERLLALEADGFAAPNTFDKAYFGRNLDMNMDKNGWVTEADGTRKHYANGKLHNEIGQPAEIRPNNTRVFYKNGKLHRDGGEPAMIASGGTTKFAVDGKYHRVGGEPAITWSKGPYRREWWVDGQIQRAERKDGTIEWYAPGCKDRDTAIHHRVDGAAIEFPNGMKEYWLNGLKFRSRLDWEAALLQRDAFRQKTEKSIDQGLIDEDPIDTVSVSEEVMNNSKTNLKTEVKKMNKQSFAEMMKANAISAGYRVAGTQLTTLVKNSILTVMKNKGADGGALQGMSAFLDTEFGAALISFVIGAGLNYVPHVSEDGRVQRLAEEMRVGGMAVAGNAIIGEAMNHVLPAVSQILANLPEAGASSNNVRVESTHDNNLVEALEEETAEENETAPIKTMKA